MRRWRCRHCWMSEQLYEPDLFLDLRMARELLELRELLFLLRPVRDELPFRVSCVSTFLQHELRRDELHLGAGQSSSLRAELWQ